MTRQMTVTEVKAKPVKAKPLALLDEVQDGEVIEITRHGLTIARLSPARGPHALKDLFVGVTRTAADDDDLLSTGEVWEAS
jgi:prevent-host-death family protein